jgi:hypothetical protein
MNKRPVLFGIAVIVFVCLALGGVDAAVILARPLMPWFAWMLP